MLLDLFSNIMCLSDSYKHSHWRQYPKDTRRIHSYFESRGGKWRDVTFFGLQYYLKQYLEGQVITPDKIDFAEEIVNEHMGPGLFHREGWEYIWKKHEGRLPVHIKAVPEGLTVPGRNVLMTIENTDENCYWLTNFLETLLVQVWYASTVCTQSREMKKLILKNLEDTGDPEGIGFKLHDFGFRGVSSVETAGVGGCAHLVNFLGTDTMAALLVARGVYGEKMAGYSIPASEHSTITSWGRKNEVAAMRNMLEKYPTGLMACVSDSFNIYDACGEIWGAKLKDQVVGRDGVLVVRPDSGHPPTVVCDAIQILWDKFGGVVNEKGYKVLDPHVRMIQGDGIDYEMIRAIIGEMKSKGWSADNIAYGSGGGLLQKLNRDTEKFAFKCSAIKREDGWNDVYKQPITDQGKESKRGRLKLGRVDYSHGSSYSTFPIDNEEYEDQMQTVFLNGLIMKEQSLAEIRKLATIHPRELLAVV